MIIVVTLLLAAACLAPGAAKLLALPQMQASAAHFGIDWSRYRLIGVLEVAAAVGVVVGLAVHPIGIAAGVGMAVLLVLALVAHQRAGDDLREAVPAIVGLGLTLAYLVLLATR